mmetsp:Transcript_105139/g.203554  ORF Transcript_105139/g.203554 Transcript_105139/m.203554 type:complete len:233 (-) Transcript_105139:354-1052(-)
MRLVTERPSGPPSTNKVGLRDRPTGAATKGGLATIRSNSLDCQPSGIAAKRSPWQVVTSNPLSVALARVNIHARGLTSEATTCFAPQHTACNATTPLPVQRSRTDAPTTHDPPPLPSPKDKQSSMESVPIDITGSIDPSVSLGQSVMIRRPLKEKNCSVPMQKREFSTSASSLQRRKWCTTDGLQTASTSSRSTPTPMKNNLAKRSWAAVKSVGLLSPVFRSRCSSDPVTRV